MCEGTCTYCVFKKRCDEDYEEFLEGMRKPDGVCGVCGHQLTLADDGRCPCSEADNDTLMQAMTLFEAGNTTTWVHEMMTHYNAGKFKLVETI